MIKEINNRQINTKNQQKKSEQKHQKGIKSEINKLTEKKYIKFIYYTFFYV